MWCVRDRGEDGGLFLTRMALLGGCGRRPAGTADQEDTEVASGMELS